MELKHSGILKKHLLLLLLLTFIPIPLCQNVSAAERQTNIVYFYITVCKSCDETQKAMDQINRQATACHPHVLMYNIENQDNLKLLTRYYDYYKVPQSNRQLPCAFIGKTYLTGKSGINQGLMYAIENDSSETPLLGKSAVRQTPTKQYFELAGTFLTGLMNGFNPCALSMLLFFISLLIAQKGSVLKTGLTFCLGKFLMFLALGTVLYRFLSSVNFIAYTNIVKALLLALILLVTALNLSDYLATKKEQYGKVKMQLPIGIRKKLNDFIRRMIDSKSEKYILPLSFITGTVVTVGEFFCTGQLYLAAIVVNIREYGSLNLQALCSLLVYDIGFVLPLTVFVVAIHKGKLIFELSEILRSRLPLIKLATAGFFLIYGLVFMVFFIRKRTHFMNWCKLQLRDSKGLNLFEGFVFELPLSEKNIVSLSIRFFNDSEPCYIHRSAVLSRVYNELDDYFKKYRPSGTIKMECLPESFRAYFDAIGGVEEIMIFDN